MHALIIKAKSGLYSEKLGFCSDQHLQDFLSSSCIGIFHQDFGSI